MAVLRVISVMLVATRKPRAVWPEIMPVPQRLRGLVLRFTQVMMMATMIEPMSTVCTGPTWGSGCACGMRAMASRNVSLEAIPMVPTATA